MHAMHRSLFLVALLLCMSLAGCTSNDASTNSGNSMSEEEKQLPEWSVGQNWLYTFITPQFGEDSAAAGFGMGASSIALFALSLIHI